MRRSVCAILRPHHRQRHHDRDERDAIRIKAARQTNQAKRDTRERWSNYARELKLGRVHRDRVGEVFASDEVVSHGEIRRTRECHTTARHKRKPEHHPAIHDIRCDERSQTNRGEARHHLGENQQPSSIDEIGKDSAGECEDEAGRGSHEGVESEPERRVGQLQNQPTLRNGLHPRADVGKKRPGPEDSVITIRKRAEHPAACGGGHEDNSLNTKGLHRKEAQRGASVLSLMWLGLEWRTRDETTSLEHL